MKFLHLCDSLNPAGLGGYESYLHYLIPELEKRGHQSFVVTQTPDRELSGQQDAQNCVIQYLSGNFLEARKWEFYRHPAHEQSALAMRLFKDNDLQENVDLLSEELEELIRREEPDIIHAHSTYIVFNRVLMKLKKGDVLAGIPLVATIHGRAKPLVLPGQIRTTDYMQFIESCPFDTILAVSRNVATQLEEHFAQLPQRHIRIQTLYLGLNLDIFSPKADARKQWDIAFLGRLEPMKSVDLLPEMLSILAPEFPDLKLLITGDGSLREQVMNEFHTRGLSDMIEYKGVVPAERVIDLIRSSRTILYPSREEPFGLSIIEAMACGVPVISTNVFGPREIITHLEDGYLISSIDAYHLAEAVHDLLKDRALQARISVSARDTVEKRFNLTNHVDRLEAIYVSLQP